MLAEMNVLNLKGELTPEQAAFFAPSKPAIELFDLQRDPHEVNNVADDPTYADVKMALLAELARWRTDVISDQGVSEDFRAKNLFPDECPIASVDQWVVENSSKYDFKKYGLPGWYPTRSLAQWEEVRAKWEPYVFRAPTESVQRPIINYSK